MVEGMVRGPVDDRLERVAGDHVRVVDENRPKVHEEEQAEVELAVEGEHEDEQVVGHGLEVAVEWVESMRREGSRDWGRAISTVQTQPNGVGAKESETHSATCGGACEATCSKLGDVPSGESSRCSSR